MASMVRTPSYLAERFPTEAPSDGERLRSSPGGYFRRAHGGADHRYLAVNMQLGFAIPMAIGTMVGLVSFIVALAFGPETRGKGPSADLVVAG